MLDQSYISEKLRDCELPDDTQDLVITIINGIMALAARATNSNSDSNSLGGIPIHFQEALQPMPAMKPRNHLILRLMSDAGLRRQEVVALRVKNIPEKALHFRGKGDKDRTAPLTEELAVTVKPFCSHKGPDDLAVGVGEGVIYRVVKKYSMLVGRPEMKPHDLRHAFATRLLKRGVNIRVIQELMGHSNVNTTQDYTAVVGSHLENAIKALNQPRETAVPDDRIEKLMELVAKIADTKGQPPHDPTSGISPVVY